MAEVSARIAESLRNAESKTPIAKVAHWHWPIALSPLGLDAGREVKPQVFDMVAAEPGDETDSGL